MTDFSLARHNMVECQVRPNDVTDTRIHQAMFEMPRELFLPKAMQDMAYLDISVEISPGRVLMEPRCLAKLLQAAKITCEDVVLDIGCATGYSTAILARLACAVVGLESDSAMVDLASRILSDLGVDNAAVVTGDLTSGCPSQGPFDVILLNGGVEIVPQCLFDQLKEGGRLITIFVDHNNTGGCGKLYQKCMVKGTEDKTNSVALDDLDLFDASLPILQGFTKPDGFVF